MNSEDEEDLDELGSDVDMGSEELTDARCGSFLSNERLDDSPLM